MLFRSEPVYLGTAKDEVDEIAALLVKGFETCDAVISTGGASVGDYDATPAAMELAGCELLVRKLSMKPGGACVYGVREGKLMFCLSGNPAAAIVNFHVVVGPSIKKLAGQREFTHKTAVVTLADDFNKTGSEPRFLRGRLDLTGGEALMHISEQGNAMLHATIGCDVLAIIPPDSGKLRAGKRLQAYLL